MRGEKRLKILMSLKDCDDYKKALYHGQLAEIIYGVDDSVNRNKVCASIRQLGMKCPFLKICTFTIVGEIGVKYFHIGKTEDFDEMINKKIEVIKNKISDNEKLKKIVDFDKKVVRVRESTKHRNKQN